MKDAIVYRTDTASRAAITEHLQHCDADFLPPLSSRVEINNYVTKIMDNAVRLEAWSGTLLTGLLAVYCNNHDTRIAFITSVSVVKIWTGRGIAASLLQQCIAQARLSGMEQIVLEVGVENDPAINLYKKTGFTTNAKNASFVTMSLNLKAEMNMNAQRDYNKEIKDTSDHKYAYGFDFDVMHPYMVKSFLPFFKEGNLLELGSFKGDFTKRLLPHFDDITCVEASDLAIAQAQKDLGGGINFINGLFENVTLPKRYDNIVLTHVLEHLDDPVLVMKRINDEWLTESGRFFLVCPNANAPSRQIAVKMGLITHNSAITPAEAEHGHRCTYSLDTLERDAVAAGLNVVHRSGIFFKALANFQWDRLLQTDIISKEYLDGCYKLGQQYPDLCSSIFLMCEKGNR